MQRAFTSHNTDCWERKKLAHSPGGLPESLWHATDCKVQNDCRISVCNITKQQDTSEVASDSETTCEALKLEGSVPCNTSVSACVCDRHAFMFASLSVWVCTCVHGCLCICMHWCVQAYVCGWVGVVCSSLWSIFGTKSMVHQRKQQKPNWLHGLLIIIFVVKMVIMIRWSTLK